MNSDEFKLDPESFAVSMDMDSMPHLGRSGGQHLSSSASHGALDRVGQIAAEVPCAASAPSSPDPRAAFATMPRAGLHATSFSPLATMTPPGRGRGRGHRRAVSDTFPLKDVNFAQFVRSDSISEEAQELTADDSCHQRIIRDLQTTMAETDALMASGAQRSVKDSTGAATDMNVPVNLARAESLNAEISNLLANKPQLPVRKSTAGHSGLSTHVLASLDPKRVKRIIANRESAARSKERKMRYTNELEAKTIKLQAELNKLKNELKGLQKDTEKAKAENAELHRQVALLEQQGQQSDTSRAGLESEILSLRDGARAQHENTHLKPSNLWTGHEAGVPQRAPVHVQPASPSHGMRLPPGMVIQLPDGRKLELPEGATIGGTTPQQQLRQSSSNIFGMENISGQHHPQHQHVQPTVPSSSQAQGMMQAIAAGTGVLAQLAAVPGALEALMRALPLQAAGARPVSMSSMGFHPSGMPTAVSSPGIALQGGVLSPEAAHSMSFPTQVPHMPEHASSRGESRCESARPANQLNKQESMEIVAGLLGSDTLDTSELDAWLNALQRDGRPMAMTSPTLSDM